MKIKANEELFDSWKAVAFQISELGTIVQNDMEITNEAFIEWLRRTARTQEVMRRLISSTTKYVTGK
jgi:hypothetical protein